MDLLVGDFNARVVEIKEGEQHIIGRHFFKSTETCMEEMSEETQENRSFFMNMCKVYNFKVCNTWFERSQHRLATYKTPTAAATAAPTPHSHDQRDFMLTKTRWFYFIIDCESNTEDKLDTDYYPVFTTMNVKFKAKR